MNLRRAVLPAGLSLAITATAVVALAQTPPPRLPPARGRGVQVAQQVRDRTRNGGTARVIVDLNLAAGEFRPEANLPDTPALVVQRAAIEAAAGRALSRLPQGAYRVRRRYTSIPQLALEIDAAALAALENAPDDVAAVHPDELLRPILAESAPLIQADQLWAAGYDGAGTTIAIVDSGVDASHPFLSGKVVEEACFSTTMTGTTQSLCPNGQESQIGPGSAAPCPLFDCIHGTHVAGIAAGDGAGAGQSFSGVAKGANLMAVQVFSEVIDPASCGGLAPCAGAFTSDVIAGLERVYSLAGQYSFASVNMSLGGSQFPAPCDDEPYKPIIDNLRAIGIATVVASGNSGSTTSISTPACISSAVSVGSTSKGDQVSWFSNVASFLSLLAPGESINSSIPGGGFLPLSGTSMAAPHVSGVWALFKQAAPAAGVDAVLTALRDTGLPIADGRFFGTATVPRVRAFQAIASLVPVMNPCPVAVSLSPSHARGGAGALTLTVNGSGFDAFSVINWNGAARPTTVVSTTQLRASIPAGDLAAAGQAEVTVSTPSPGGGTSSGLIFTIDPPPVLSVSSTIAAPGSAVTVTLTNGVGGPTDWLALAATTAPNSTYLQWTYVGNTVTTRTWTVNLPTTGGPFEFRLFLNGSYTRAATSPSIAIDPTYTGAPVAASLTPAAAVVGSAAFSLKVNGSGFVSSSVVRWNGANRPTTFVSASQLQASIGAGDLAATGTAAVSVFTPAPGGGTSASLPFSIRPAPTLTVSATSAAGGSSVTVTLADGLGGSTDWLALAATTAPNTSYLQWTYVGSGITNRTWSATLPSAGGPYEFRLFTNGYTRAATSPPIALQTGAPVLTSLSPASAAVGSAGFTLTVNGSGFTAASIVRWNGADRSTTFVGSTQVKAAILSGDLAAAGTVAVTVFTPAPGGGTSGSLPFTVGQLIVPALTVNATSVAPGGQVTVTLTNGPGGSSDWLAIAAAGAPNTSYLQWTSVGAGVTTRTWTVTLPTVGGPFEFRLFTSGYSRAATSPQVAIDPALSPQPPALTVSAASVAPGASVTVTLANGFGGTSDWLALAASGAPNTSYVNWTYVGAGVTTRTWTVTMPTTSGTYEFRLFLSNGYTRAATSPIVTVSP